MAERQPSRALRIVVADDHDDIRRLMVAVLLKHFDVVDAVASGRELVDAALILKPDVIVSDISMPLLSGPDAMAELREAGSPAPFVLVTACAANALEWINVGALAVIDKLDLDAELVAAVKSAAEGFSYLSARARRSCP